MKTSLHWPIEVVYGKYQSSIKRRQPNLRKVAINRIGVIEFQMPMLPLRRHLHLTKNMLALAALAALQDEEHFGDHLTPMQRDARMPSN